jgi:hypothetical protein
MRLNKRPILSAYVYNFQRLASTFHPFFNRLFSERRWEEVAEHA